MLYRTIKSSDFDVLIFKPAIFLFLLLFPMFSYILFTFNVDAIVAVVFYRFIVLSMFLLNILPELMRHKWHPFKSAAS